MSSLKILNDVPSEFLDISHRQIKKVFKTPTLIHLKGDKTPALFVSILLHGNEFSGLEIMQEILEKYKTTNGYKLPRDLWLFVGNVDAAELDVRLMDSQVDFNRAWPGTPNPKTDTAKLIQKVVDTITKEPLFASVDLHNNTGQNPHYGCISVVDEKNRYLCSLFNHIAMVFKGPKGVSTVAFDNICPDITLECSTPGNIPAKDKAFQLVDALMHMDHFPTKPVVKQDLQLLKNSATIKINKDVTFDFENNVNDNFEVDLVVVDRFDKHNFVTLKKGEVFAYSKLPKPLFVVSSDNKDITDEIIQNENGEISLKKSMMPAMISMDKKIVFQDCLCYLLEDY
jgi:hypothetical protein